MSKYGNANRHASVSIQAWYYIASSLSGALLL